MELSVQRVEIECEEEHLQIEMRGKWKAVALNGDGDAQQAAEMADRYNRLFLRTLRQLRDLRRYVVPVTINNPQQVNIAADGGQQVNVQRSKRRAKTGKAGRGKTSGGRASKTKPKQLAAKSAGESIRIEATSDAIVGKS